MGGSGRPRPGVLDGRPPGLDVRPWRLELARHPRHMAAGPGRRRAGGGPGRAAHRRAGVRDGRQGGGRKRAAGAGGLSAALARPGAPRAGAAGGACRRPQERPVAGAGPRRTGGHGDSGGTGAFPAARPRAPTGAEQPGAADADQGGQHPPRGGEPAGGQVRSGPGGRLAPPLAAAAGACAYGAADGTGGRGQCGDGPAVGAAVGRFHRVDVVGAAGRTGHGRARPAGLAARSRRDLRRPVRGGLRPAPAGPLPPAAPAVARGSRGRGLGRPGADPLPGTRCLGRGTGVRAAEAP